MKQITIIVFVLLSLFLFTFTVSALENEVRDMYTKRKISPDLMEKGSLTGRPATTPFVSRGVSEESAQAGMEMGGRDFPWNPNILAGDGWSSGAIPDLYTSMAIGPGGEIYVAYQARHWNDTEWSIGIAQSLNGGLTWVNNAFGWIGVNEMYPDVAVDDDGYIYIAFTDEGAAQGELNIARSVSPNNINSFTGYYWTSDPGVYRRYPSIEVFGSEGSDLHLLVAMTVEDGDGDDQVAWWNTAVGEWTGSMSGWITAAGDSEMHPDVALSSSTAYVTYVSNVTGADKERIVRYLDITSAWNGDPWNGWIWTTSGDDEYPSICATGSNVYLAWQNNYYGEWDILHTHSVDNGVNWDGTAIAYSTNNEMYPRVYGTGSLTGVVYLETSNVKFKSSPSLGSVGTWVPAEDAIPERVTDQDTADESVRSASLVHTGSHWVATWADSRNTGTTGIDIWSSNTFVDTTAPTVMVTVPNGGEVWSSGSLYYLNWSAQDDIDVSSHKLEYSTDGGSSWSLIQDWTAGNPQIYAWTVPDDQSTQCRVKVSCKDPSDNEGSDMSDNDFTIQDGYPPTVTVYVPNGGEVWEIGSSHVIGWDASDPSGVGSYKLEYSANSGASWQLIQDWAAGNPEIYLWTIPFAFSTNCRVKVTCKDIYDNESNDYSDSDFTITDTSIPTVTVATPNGGEMWDMGSTHDITWVADDPSGITFHKLEYSTDSGSSWSLIQDWEWFNPGTYSWTVPPTPSTQCRVKVTCKDYFDNEASDISDGDFTIVDTPVSTVNAEYTCEPPSGTVPFSTSMTVTLFNLAASTRRVAAGIQVIVANGTSYNPWKFGFVNVTAASSFVSQWNVTIPALGTVIGNNTFRLYAEDVTPSPYNQPPYPPAGDTATAACTVTGVAP